MVENDIEDQIGPKRSLYLDIKDRPAKLTDYITKNALSILEQNPHKIFPCLGVKRVIFGKYNSDDLIQKSIVDDYFPDILDIGTGNGLFLQALKKNFGIPWKNLMGISLQDYRKKNESQEDIPDQSYCVANYENTLLFAKKKFDYIFSSHTFNYFFDPLGSLVSTYSLLKKNGTLVVNSLGLSKKSLVKLCKILNQDGYDAKLISSGTYLQEETLVFVRNSKKNLELPVEYIELDDNIAHYRFVK